MTSLVGNSPKFSAIITTLNESSDLSVTLGSITDSASQLLDAIIVDDGSDQGAFDDLKFASSTLGNRCSFKRHDSPLGIGRSRDEACRSACGQVFAILDAHHLFQSGCLDDCSRVAYSRNAIVTPCISDFPEGSPLLHGASFEALDCPPPFSANWRLQKSRREVHPISSLKAPAYVIPASVYPKVAWSPLLRGWGGSEACVSLKAFFTGVPILHLCGPIAYHKFKTKFHYPVTWDEIWRNHALIARICFSDRTWYDYWLPKIFEPHLNANVQREMDSPEVRDEQRAFQKLKVRPDHEFWTRLVFRAVPKMLRID